MTDDRYYLLCHQKVNKNTNKGLLCHNDTSIAVLAVTSAVFGTLQLFTLLLIVE